MARVRISFHPEPSDLLRVEMCPLYQFFNISVYNLRHIAMNSTVCHSLLETGTEKTISASRRREWLCKLDENGSAQTRQCCQRRKNGHGLSAAQAGRRRRPAARCIGPLRTPIHRSRVCFGPASDAQNRRAV